MILCQCAANKLMNISLQMAQKNGELKNVRPWIHSLPFDSLNRFSKWLFRLVNSLTFFITTLRNRYKAEVNAVLFGQNKNGETDNNEGNIGARNCRSLLSEINNLRLHKWRKMYNKLRGKMMKTAGKWTFSCYYRSWNYRSPCNFRMLRRVRVQNIRDYDDISIVWKMLAEVIVDTKKSHKNQFDGSV